MMEYWASLLSDFQALSPTGKLGFVVGIAGVSLWSLSATIFGFLFVRGRNYRKVAQRLADELAMLETRLDEAHADLVAQQAEREQFEPHRWMEAAALEEANGREEQAVLLVEDGVTRVRTAFAASMTLLAGHYLSRIVGPEAERHLQNGLYYARAAASLDTDNREAAFLLEEALLEQGVGAAAVAQAPASFLPYDQAEAKQIIRAVEERAAPLIQAGRYRLAVRLYRRGELVVERARLHRTGDGWLMIFRLTQARMLAQESRAAAKTIDALLEASEAISGRLGSEMLKARVLEASLRQQMGDHAYSLKLIDEILVPLEALEGSAGPNVVVARLTGVKARHASPFSLASRSAHASISSIW